MLTVFLSVGPVVTGLWCDRCLLPSAMAFDVHILAENGLGEPIPCTRCTDCDN